MNAGTLHRVSLAALLLLAVFAPAHVAAQAGGDVLRACVIPGTGTLYLIERSGMPGECVRDEHVEIAFHVVGPRGPAGADGLPGPAGPAGEPGRAGATGPQGPQGPAGPEGPQGPEGPAGPPGPSGPAGAAGTAGLTGPEGPPGERGPQGERGPPGDKGERGEPGERGQPGEPGERGEPGAPGERGEPGAPGERGERGEAGPPGLEGPPGPKGDKGDRGAGVACWDLDEDGEKDPDEDVNADGKHNPQDCRGERGDRGERGEPGPPGSKGDRGNDGISGYEIVSGQVGAPGGTVLCPTGKIALGWSPTSPSDLQFVTSAALGTQGSRGKLDLTISPQGERGVSVQLICATAANGAS